MAIVRRYDQHLVIISILLVGMVLAVWRLPEPEQHEPLSSWRVVEVSNNSIYPLQAPLIIDNLIFWQSFRSDTLNVQHLSGEPRYQHDWLHGKIEQWQVVPTRIENYLVWRTNSNALWGALLAADGGQITAPIRITDQSVSNFQLTTLTNGQPIIMWNQPDNLYLSVVDLQGRPRFPVALNVVADNFDILGTADDRLSIVWQMDQQLFLGEIQLTVAPTLNLTTPLDAFDMAEGEYLSNLQLFRTDLSLGVLWGITHAAHPDQESYQGILLNNNAVQSFELPANLRWVTVSDDQMAVAVYQAEKWQVGIIEFDAAGVATLQLVDGLEVTAAPPVVAGQHLAWGTLNENLMPELYITTPDARFGQLQYPSSQPAVWQSTVRNGLKHSYLGLLWLIPSLLGFYFLREHQIPAALGIYWFAKHMLNFGLFGQYPEVFEESGYPVFWLGLGAMFGITLIAGLSAGFGWQNKHPIFRYATYCLTDLILTFAIFGSRVEWAGFFR